ncbi:MAG: hypothetical protein JWR52_1465 [Marmoricola sp.]|nr:hypothetical protein [Marmoricola sp.]
MKVRTAVTALGCLTLAAGVLVSRADASTPPPPTSLVVRADARGDVQHFSLPTINGDFIQQAAPTRRNGDISSVRLTHTRTSVRVFLRFVELNPTGEQHAYEYTIRTPRFTRSVTFGAWPGQAPPIDRGSYWTGSPPMMFGAHGNRLACSGMARTIDYGANTVLLVVPRRCLGYPRWVAVGPRLTEVTGYLRGYFDDGYYSGTQLKNPPATGPRAYTPSALPN